MHHLQAAGVRAGAVLKSTDALADPQYQARGFIDHTHHPEAGDFKHPGVSFKSSPPLSDLGRRAPLFAEHSDWVLDDLLGVPPEAVDALHTEGVVPLVPVTRKIVNRPPKWHNRRANALTSPKRRSKVMSLKDKYCIVGAATTKFGRVPGVSPLQFTVEAAKLAIEDAGLEKKRRRRRPLQVPPDRLQGPMGP